MKTKALVALRILIGAMMAVTGIVKFIKPDFKVAENATLQAFIDSGWLWPLIGAAETVGGLSLLSGQFVPLGLGILAPVVVGIFAFSLKTGGEEASVGMLLLLLHGCLSWQYRAHFIGLFAQNAKPSVSVQPIEKPGRSGKSIAS